MISKGAIFHLIAFKYISLYGYIQRVEHVGAVTRLDIKLSGIHPCFR